jgi:uncharacterized protein
MFERKALSFLREWSEKNDRKPLIIRGARQVGKTTLVNLFASEFDQYLYLNLEIPEQRELFNNKSNFQELEDAIFLRFRKTKSAPKTLIFIDEIQNSPNAVAWLRYFYEEAKHLYVIAAGSLLESSLGTHISFPVGRVEYLPVRPFSFEEFLNAAEERQSIELLSQLPFPEFAHDIILNHFKLYTLIGGMPEIINKYLTNRDFVELDPVFDALIYAYEDDFEKYAKNMRQVNVMRHTIRHAFDHAGMRIKFEKFGQQDYKSTEVKDAFLTLERAMLLKLVYPLVTTMFPPAPNLRKSPRLQLLDTGIVNYFSGTQYNVFSSHNLTDIYQGRIAEHIVGQELTSLQTSMLSSIHFWTREKDADAEVDFIYPYKGLVIPIEVKSGAKGHLRSLHEFIDRAEHPFAVRVSSMALKLEDAATRSGKKFKLLNLPFYLTHRIGDYLSWMMSQ